MLLAQLHASLEKLLFVRIAEPSIRRGPQSPPRHVAIDQQSLYVVLERLEKRRLGIKETRECVCERIHIRQPHRLGFEFHNLALQRSLFLLYFAQFLLHGADSIVAFDSLVLPLGTERLQPCHA